MYNLNYMFPCYTSIQDTISTNSINSSYEPLKTIINIGSQEVKPLENLVVLKMWGRPQLWGLEPLQVAL